MMKKIIFLASISFCTVTGYAQKSSTNTLKIPVDKTRHIALNTSDASVDVEGYDGDDLIIEAVTNKFPKVIPPNAEGLNQVKLNNRPAEDNTISYKLIVDNGIIYQLGITTKCKYLHIKVPNHLYLFSILASCGRPDAYISLKNLEGAFQLEGLITTINVSNVAGPFEITGGGEKVIISNILWNKDAVWPFSSPDYTMPYLISSTTGDIDISLPEELKASISFRQGNGHVYSDLNLTQGPRPTLTLNGDGVKILADCRKGDIYLRKQKK